MTWTDLAWGSLVALAFVLLPGLLVAKAGYLRGFLAVAVAPALSTTAIALGAVAAGLLGVAWAWWTPFAAAVLMGGALRLVLRLAVRLGRDVQVVPRGRPSPSRELSLWLGLALSGVLMLRQLTLVLQRPEAISQTFDNIFHLSAVRYVVETGRASSLSIGGVTRVDGGASFYPAAFHDLASLVFQVGPSDVPLAVNASAVALAGLVWPLACLGLVRLVLPESIAGVLGASVLAVSFSTFPILFLDFGVLYPNLYGLALVPLMYGLTVQLLGLQTERHTPPVTAAALLLLMVPGLVLAHPNALIVVIVMVAAPVIAWFVRTSRARWSSPRPVRAVALPVTVFAAYAGVSLVAWQVVRPPEEAATWPPIVSGPHAMGEALLNAAPGGGRAAWLVSFIVVAGIVVALRTGRWWLVGSWATIVGLWVVVAAFGPSELRTFLTGIWYNDPWRFSAMIPLVSFPLGALAIQWGGGLLSRMADRRAPRRLVSEHRLARPGLARVSGVPLVVVVLLVFGTQPASYMETSLARAAASYALTPDSPLVTTDEFALIMRVPDVVGESAVVATNPWNGSSMLYALTGIPTTTTHTLYSPTADQTTLRNELDEIAASPEACAAAQRLGVTHVLAFGTREIHGRSNPYPGLLDMADAEGFREVDREGAAVLFELTMCR